MARKLLPVVLDLKKPIQTLKSILKANCFADFGMELREQKFSVKGENYYGSENWNVLFGDKSPDFTRAKLPMFEWLSELIVVCICGSRIG